MKQVDLTALSIGAELGDGGQGKVYAVVGVPDVAFKRFHDSAAAGLVPQALDELDARAADLRAGGRPVQEWAAWPHTQVTERGRCIGFLMPLVPERFTLHVGGRPRLADLSYLATDPKPMWGQVYLPDTSVRVEILAQYCTVVQALHDRDLVIGDMSFGNVLWSAAPTPGVMLLDCDGIRPEGGRSLLPQYDTLDWHDPVAVPAVSADRDRDRYKLALAVLRVLTRSLSMRPEALGQYALDIPEESAARIRALAARAAGPIGTRPSATEWRSALRARRTVTVAKPTPRTVDAPAPHPELLMSRGERRTRPVTPPSATS